MLSGDPKSSLRTALNLLNYRTELLEHTGENVKKAKSEVHAVVSETSKPKER